MQLITGHSKYSLYVLISVESASFAPICPAKWLLPEFTVNLAMTLVCLFGPTAPSFA